VSAAGEGGLSAWVVRTLNDQVALDRALEREAAPAVERERKAARLREIEAVRVASAVAPRRPRPGPGQCCPHGVWLGKFCRRCG
jgi:hypothetical protein